MTYEQRKPADTATAADDNAATYDAWFKAQVQQALTTHAPGCPPMWPTRALPPDATRYAGHLPSSYRRFTSADFCPDLALSLLPRHLRRRKKAAHGFGGHAIQIYIPAFRTSFGVHRQATSSVLPHWSMCFSFFQIKRWALMQAKAHFAKNASKSPPRVGFLFCGTMFALLLNC